MIKLDPSNVILSAFSVPICALGVPELYSNCIPVFPNVLSFIINFLFAASNLISVPDFILSLVIVNPPIVPPSNKTSLPVIWPESFNLRLLLEDLSSSDDNVNPPISPPENNTLDPVICPEALITKLLSVDAILIESNSNPPMVPPSNNTLDAVIWPDAPFNFNVPAVESKSSPIVNPPISPAAAVIVPDIVTLPSGVKWKLEDEISILPLLPDTNWDVPPNKKVGAFICNALPERLPTACPTNVPFINCNVDAVTCPDAFSLNLELADFISSSFTLNPAIDADLNIAKPWSDIDADALATDKSAGTNILFAETDPSIVTSLVIRPPFNKNLDAVISPVGCIWYPDDDISNNPFDPEINWTSSFPKKNLGVCISTLDPLINNRPVFWEYAKCPAEEDPIKKFPFESKNDMKSEIVALVPSPSAIAPWNPNTSDVIIKPAFNPPVVFISPIDPDKKSKFGPVAPVAPPAPAAPCLDFANVIVFNTLTLALVAVISIVPLSWAMADIANTFPASPPNVEVIPVLLVLE